MSYPGCSPSIFSFCMMLQLWQKYILGLKRWWSLILLTKCYKWCLSVFYNTGSEVYDQLGPVWCNYLWPWWHPASCVWINSQSWVIWYQCWLDSWSGHSSIWNEVSKHCKTFLSVSSALRYYFSPLDGMPLHHKDTPGTSSGFPDSWPVPIYNPGWREAWGEESLFLRTQHSGLAKSNEPRPLNPESSTWTASHSISHC